MELRQELSKGKPAELKPLPMNQFGDVLKLAGGIQGARSTLQTAILGMIFVSTGGSLAATYGASFVNQAIFSLLQRYSSERMKKKSLELAEELRDFNIHLRAIRDKQKQQRDVGKGVSSSANDSPVLSSEISGLQSIPDSPIMLTQDLTSLGIGATGMEDISLPSAEASLSSAGAATSPESESVGDKSVNKSETDQLTRALLALELLLPDSMDEKNMKTRGN